MRTVEPLESSRQRRWGAAATWAVALTTAALLAAPTHAAGTKLYVATNGVDTADCGPEGLLPCRSISRAIAHAVAGDELAEGIEVAQRLAADAARIRQVERGLHDTPGQKRVEPYATARQHARIAY